MNPLRAALPSTRSSKIWCWILCLYSRSTYLVFFGSSKDFTTFTLHDLTDFYVERATAPHYNTLSFMFSWPLAKFKNENAVHGQYKSAVSGHRKPAGHHKPAHRCSLCPWACWWHMRVWFVAQLQNPLLISALWCQPLQSAMQCPHFQSVRKCLPERPQVSALPERRQCLLQCPLLTSALKCLLLPRANQNPLLPKAPQMLWTSPRTFEGAGLYVHGQSGRAEGKGHGDPWTAMAVQAPCFALEASHVSILD